MRKEQLKNAVMETLVEKGILQEEALSALTPAGLPPQHETPPQGYSIVTTLDAEKLFEPEKLKLQTKALIRLAEVEKDEEVRLTQIEAEEKKSTNELQIRVAKEEEAQRRREEEKKKIKPSEVASQLSNFVEDDIDSYFRTFEKIATQSEWPRDKWLAFLVPKLIGKAYKIYATLDADSDYDAVKSTSLRAFFFYVSPSICRL